MSKLGKCIPGKIESTREAHVVNLGSTVKGILNFGWSHLRTSHRICVCFWKNKFPNFKSLFLSSGELENNCWVVEKCVCVPQRIFANLAVVPKDSDFKLPVQDQILLFKELRSFSSFSKLLDTRKLIKYIRLFYVHAFYQVGLFVLYAHKHAEHLFRWRRSTPARRFLVTLYGQTPLCVTVMAGLPPFSLQCMLIRSDTEMWGIGKLVGYIT